MRFAIALLTALVGLSSAHSPTFGRRSSLDHLLLARKAATCSCANPSAGYGAGKGELKIATSLPFRKTAIATKKTPKIRDPTKTTVTDGSAKAIQQLVARGVISKATGDKLIACAWAS